MKCEEFFEYLIKEIEGELSPDEAKRVAVHFEECPNCRGEKENLLSVVSALRDVPVPPPFYFERLSARITDKIQGKERRAKIFRWAFAPALVALFVGIISVWIFVHQPKISSDEALIAGFRALPDRELLLLLEEYEDINSVEDIAYLPIADFHDALEDAFWFNGAGEISEEDLNLFYFEVSDDMEKNNSGGLT